MHATFSKIIKLSMLWIVLGGLIGLISFPACSKKKAGPPVEGKWESASKQTLEFREDGTLAGRDKFDREITGNYEWIDPEHLRLDMTVRTVDKAAGTVGVDKASGVCKVVVEGDSMTMIEEDGSEERFRRVP